MKSYTEVAAIRVRENDTAHTIEIDGLEDMQEAVGGFVEPCSWIFGDNPAVYVNEEGKFNGSDPNRAVYAAAGDEGCVKWDGSTVHEGDVLDIIYGDFVCIGFDPETGEDRDITDEEVARVRERFGTLRSLDSGWMEALTLQLQVRAARA